MSTNKSYFQSNEAIKHNSFDRYNFNPYAEKIQEAIRNSSLTDEPLIFGLYGKWGEGKSSFLNLVFKNLELDNNSKKGIIKFRFNPWRYNSEEKLLFEFFNGLIEVINHKYKSSDENNLINKLKLYTETILSGSSVEIEKGFNFVFKSTVKTTYSFKDSIEKFQKKKIKSLETQKDEIDKNLKAFNYRIVIFIDDIDRLTKEEVSNVFRLVKLSASFKNLTFILAFDNEIVAKSIYKNFGDSIEDGYKYLEKIVNIPISLPKVDKSNLLQELKDKLKKVFKTCDIEYEDYLPVRLNHTYENGVYRFFDEISSVVEYIDTPRMLIRLTNTFSTDLIILKGEVNYSDLLWLELLKIKYLKVYDFIKSTPELFVNYEFGSPFIVEDNYSNSLSAFLEQENFSSYEKEEVLAIIQVLFPLDNNGMGALFADMSEVRRVKKSSEDSKTERRINDYDSFRVFFDYHTIGRISNFILDSFIGEAKKEEVTKKDLVENLKKIVTNSNSFEIRYELEKRIKKLSEKPKYKLIFVLLDSLEILIQENENSEDNIHGRTQREDYIHSIFAIINGLTANQQFLEQVLNEVSEKLSIPDIIAAISGFSYENFEGGFFQQKINEIIINRIKEKHNDVPFYNTYKGTVSRSIMFIWDKVDSNEFKNYLKIHLSGENISTYIKSFASYWITSSSDYDLSKRDYDFMDKKGNYILTDTLYEISQTQYPELNSVTSTNEEELLKSYESIDGFKYLIQFTYWHKEKRNLLNIE